LGAAAVDLILNNEYGKAVGVKGNQITAVDLYRAVEKKKGIGVNSSYQLMRNLI
jgi:6-phosphofructokinase